MLNNDKIVELFPKEIRAVYFVSPISKRYSKTSKRRSSKRRIDGKYRNLRKLLKKSKVIDFDNSNDNLLTNLSAKDGISTTWWWGDTFEMPLVLWHLIVFAFLVISEEMRQSKKYLQNHCEPFEDVKRHCRETIEIRRQYFATTTQSIEEFIIETS